MAVFAGKRAWSKFSVKTLNTLENIFCDRLAYVLDYIITTRWEKMGKTLLPLSEVAKISGKSHDTLKVAASRKQIIAFQKNKKWFSHPDFLEEPRVSSADEGAVMKNQ